MTTLSCHKGWLPTQQSAALKPHIKQDLHVFHYMDDILAWDNFSTDREVLSDQPVPSLAALGFNISLSKVQMIPPIFFWAPKFPLWKWGHLNLFSHSPSILTLTSLQSFLGNLKWLLPWLPIPSTTLQVLFDFLWRDKAPTSKWKLTDEAFENLAKINQALHGMASARFSSSLCVQLLIFNTSPTLMGALHQPAGVLEWLHMPVGELPPY